MLRVVGVAVGIDCVCDVLSVALGVGGEQQGVGEDQRVSLIDGDILVGDHLRQVIDGVDGDHDIKEGVIAVVPVSAVTVCQHQGDAVGSGLTAVMDIGHQTVVDVGLGDRIAG